MKSYTIEIHEGMEDAPKDGRWFLAFSTASESWEIMSWYRVCGGFVIGWKDCINNEVFTHWCELPGNPRVENGEVKG